MEIEGKKKVGGSENNNKESEAIHSNPNSAIEGGEAGERGEEEDKQEDEEAKEEEKATAATLKRKEEPVARRQNPKRKKSAPADEPEHLTAEDKIGIRAAMASKPKLTSISLEAYHLGTPLLIFLEFPVFSIFIVKQGTETFWFQRIRSEGDAHFGR